MSWLFGAICLVTMLSTVVATARIPVARGDRATISLASQMRLVASSERYLRILLVGFLQKLAEGIGYASFAYFCIYVVEQPLSGIGLVVLAATAGQVLTQPLWLRASRRWQPAILYTASVLGWCLNLLLWLAMKGQSEWWLISHARPSGGSGGGRPADGHPVDAIEYDGGGRGGERCQLRRHLQWLLARCREAGCESAWNIDPC